jgi:hypothetical protein
MKTAIGLLGNVDRDLVDHMGESFEGDIKLLELVAQRAREEMRDAISNEMMAIAVEFKDSPYALAIVESALRVKAMKVKP